MVTGINGWVKVTFLNSKENSYYALNWVIWAFLGPKSTFLKFSLNFTVTFLQEDKGVKTWVYGVPSFSLVSVQGILDPFGCEQVGWKVFCASVWLFALGCNQIGFLNVLDYVNVLNCYGFCSRSQYLDVLFFHMSMVVHMGGWSVEEGLSTAFHSTV